MMDSMGDQPPPTWIEEETEVVITVVDGELDMYVKYRVKENK